MQRRNHAPGHAMEKLGAFIASMMPARHRTVKIFAIISNNRRAIFAGVGKNDSVAVQQSLHLTLDIGIQLRSQL